MLCYSFYLVCIQISYLATAVASINIKNARKHFEKLERKYQASQSVMGGSSMIKMP